MRKNHHGKKDRLVKRVFALCLALAVICTCLVPVFATEYDDVVDSGDEEVAGFGGDEAAGFGEPREVYDDSEVAGFGGDEAAGFGEPREVYDDSEVAGFGGDEAAGFGEPREVYDDSETTSSSESSSGNYTVEEKDDALVYVLNPDPSSSTGTDPVTQWSGEDDVVEKPDDKVVVSGDEIKKLQDMVVYRFWLKELNTLDLQDIATKAQNDNMTESEYLARNGEVLWGLYFIQAVPRAETIADYSSYIKNPSSNQDPTGELRLFDYWYTLDDLGNRVRLDLSDPTSNILDDKTTTVNVYAAWKDGTVGSDEEEKVDHEDLVDKNPVPVNLTAKAVASYEDEKGKVQSVDLPVKVKNLPSAADHISVSHMGDKSMTEFCNTYKSELQGMLPLLGLKISPKNAKGETVQPANGDKATVTVSGLNELPEIAAMDEVGALTADALKVLHLKNDGTVETVETLGVVSYKNGTLTFETTSFSPFVVALTGGYDTELLDEPVMSLSVEDKTYVINVNQKVRIDGVSGYTYNSWSSSDSSIVSIEGIQDSDTSINAVGEKAGTATLTHTYSNKKYSLNKPTEKFTVIVNGTDSAAVYFLFDPEKNANKNDNSEWAGVLTYNGSNATVNTTNATWGSGENDNKNLNYKNIKTNVNSYITTWPDGKTSGTSNWILDKTARKTTVSNTQNGNTSHDTVENFVFNNYKSKLQNLGLSQEIINQLEPKDITITLVPYKISRDNSTNPDKHIDCNVVVTCEKTYTAKFLVQYPGANDYEEVSSKIYLTDQPVNKYPGNDVGKPITDKNGATWVFDGWYPENDAGTGPKPNATPISNWPYTVSENELTNHGGDRVVNFYAHYKKATSNVTITKHVTGLLGDTNKDFDFRVSITQNNVDCSADVKAKKNGETVSLNGFTLKHGETVTLENVPIGATIKVTEVTPGAHYKVSATGQNGEKDGSSDVAFTYVAAANTDTASDAGGADLMLLSMDEDTAVDADGDAVAYDSGIKVDNNQIIVTNHATLIPDTGVLLDTLPYIVILAVVAGGVALLMLRKHRKEDD